MAPLYSLILIRCRINVRWVRAVLAASNVDARMRDSPNLVAVVRGDTFIFAVHSNALSFTVQVCHNPVILQSPGISGRPTGVVGNRVLADGKLGGRMAFPSGGSFTS